LGRPANGASTVPAQRRPPRRSSVDEPSHARAAVAPYAQTGMPLTRRAASDSAAGSRRCPARSCHAASGVSAAPQSGETREAHSSIMSRNEARRRSARHAAPSPASVCSCCLSAVAGAFAAKRVKAFRFSSFATVSRTPRAEYRTVSRKRGRTLPRTSRLAAACHTSVCKRCARLHRHRFVDEGYSLQAPRNPPQEINA